MGAPTLMQLSHWACRIRHHVPISHYLSSSTASCIRGPGHSLLYSTLSLHTTSPPTHPPTHPPINTPLTYGVIRLPTGRSAASCHITRIEWGHHKSRPQHVEWNIELEPAPNTGASHNGPPILASHSTNTSSSLQMQMKPLPVKPLTPTLQEDLMVGEPSTTSGATSLQWTNGTTMDWSSLHL